ncbi:LicD family protein [Paratractidigestivibacter faecalis]|uniref:LicD family protein n=1 Tax=Paratractidigestivibacter faecalis TaxID=2292441 RepID=UPI003F9E4275
MKELDRICREHGLTYSLAYGTALGAVRHGGFIPWDDDIDIVMPRPDYERLLSLFKNGLKCLYKLVSYRDGSSIYQFAKLIDENTSSYETFVGRDHATGLWVDIFPIEPTDEPSSPQAREVFSQNRRTGLARSFAVADPAVGSTAFVKLVKRIVCPFARHLDVARLNKRLDERARSLSKDALGSGAPYYLDVLGDMRTIPGEYLFPCKDIAFEDAVFLGPAQPEKYLEFQFGNWRQLPPPEQRFIHFPEAYLKEEN